MQTTPRAEALARSRARSKQAGREFRERRREARGFAFGRNDVQQTSPRSSASPRRPLQTSSYDATLALGCRVTILDKRGRPRRLDCGNLRYLGPAGFSTGRQVWCGIELDLELGKHDGTVEGLRYFATGHNRGLMVPAELCRNVGAPAAVEIVVASPVEMPAAAPAGKKDHPPALAKYVRMLGFGVPRSAVVLKMISDGVRDELVREFGDVKEAPSQQASTSTFRPLHWDAVASPARRPALDVHSEDWSELVASFGRGRRTAPHMPKELQSRSPSPRRRPRVLDGRRAMNVSIMLGKIVGSGLFESSSAVADALVTRSRAFTAEQLELLAAMVPSADEAAKLRQFEPVNPAEVALYELARVPQCRERIHAELLVASARSRLGGVFADALVRCETCTWITKCDALKRCLDTVDSVATTLRSGRPEPETRVALGSLISLCRAKGADDRSVLDVVVAILANRGELDVVSSAAHAATRADVTHDAAFPPCFRPDDVAGLSSRRRVKGLKAASARGEPRELSLVTSGIRHGLARAKQLVQAEIETAHSAERDRAQRAVNAALEAEAARQREAERRDAARRRAEMRRMSAAERERWAELAADAEPAAVTLAFAALDALAARVPGFLATLSSSSSFSQLRGRSFLVHPKRTPTSKRDNGKKTPVSNNGHDSDADSSESPPDAPKTPRRVIARPDPSAWARQRQERIERANAKRAVIKGTALAGNHRHQPSPSPTRRPNKSRSGMRLPERLASALHEHGRDVIPEPLLRAAYEWMCYVLRTRESVASPKGSAVKKAAVDDFWKLVEVAASRARLALTWAARRESRFKWLADIAGRREDELPVDEEQESTRMPKPRSALLAAISKGPLLAKRRTSKSDCQLHAALLVHATSMTREIRDIEMALDAADAAVSAAAALGDELRRALASAESTDASIAAVAEFGRLLGHALEASGLVARPPRHHHELRVGDAALTPYGSGVIDALRTCEAGRRRVVVRLTCGPAYCVAHLDASALARPPCRVQTPYGPGRLVHCPRRAQRHSTVELPWGTAHVRHADLRWLSTPNDHDDDLCDGARKRCGSPTSPGATGVHRRTPPTKGAISPGGASTPSPASDDPTAHVPRADDVDTLASDDDASSKSSDLDSEVGELSNLGSFLEV